MVTTVTALKEVVEPHPRHDLNVPQPSENLAHQEHRSPDTTAQIT
jgi:hypothetical protein